jgi:CheY-like chemotaxis protein
MKGRGVADTLLLVEDDSAEAEALSLVLAAEGYTVARAADGEQALDYLAQRPAPDLIMLDMIMPGMDGWHFLHEHKRHPQLARLPVLVMTATPAIGREWAEDHGCAGWLSKPAPAEQLLDEIERCLKKPNLEPRPCS